MTFKQLPILLLHAEILEILPDPMKTDTLQLAAVVEMRQNDDVCDRFRVDELLHLHSAAGLQIFDVVSAGDRQQIAGERLDVSRKDAGVEEAEKRFEDFRFDVVRDADLFGLGFLHSGLEHGVEDGGARRQDELMSADDGNASLLTLHIVVRG